MDLYLNGQIKPRIVYLISQLFGFICYSIVLLVSRPVRVNPLFRVGDFGGLIIWMLYGV